MELGSNSIESAHVLLLQLDVLLELPEDLQELASQAEVDPEADLLPVHAAVITFDEVVALIDVVLGSLLVGLALPGSSDVVNDLGAVSWAYRF